LFKFKEGDPTPAGLILTLKMSFKHRIAYFISPHGFGHAARAAAVMAAIHEIDRAIQFEIFTKVPSWFFQDSIFGPFSYHSLLADIGLIQETPLHADLQKTVRQLNDFLPFDPSRIASHAKAINRLKCELVICDIAPMGISVAREAGVRSVLVENFTWDWLYQEYIDTEIQMNKHIVYLQSLFEAADYHVQTEPVCWPRKADLTTLPVSRSARTLALQIREELGIPDDAKAVMITMGGIQERYTFLKELANQRDIYFVIPGSSKQTKTEHNLVLLPHNSSFYHPDLINACDAVIGKVGYSTLAEVYHAGVPFGYIIRPYFRESEILADYIRKQMNAIAIEETNFQNGNWLSHLPDLLTMSFISRGVPNGAEQIARFICALINDRETYKQTIVSS